MKKLRIGIFGGGRGEDVAKNFMMLGCDIVAMCENREDRKNMAIKKLGNAEIPVYDDFDKFLECGLDAVIVANYFNEHAFYAVKCLEKGIHVYSECISNGTMADGVKLVRAAEKSKSVYMLAENYPQMKFNREITRVARGGTLGKILYAEGEYNHPVDPKDVSFIKEYRYYEKHWRNFLPATYYITHSLGPIMAATGATPKRVFAFDAFAPYEEISNARRVGDRAAIITTQNDDGSVFKFTGCSAFGAHGNSYRVCGTQGQIENLRGTNGKIMLRYNSWSIPEGLSEINAYEPEINDPDAKFIAASGHDGSDYLTARIFVNCINNGEKPPFPFDVYSAVNMSSVAILAHRAVLSEGGNSYEIPDLRLDENRKKYENDNLSPFYGADGSAPTVPCCSHVSYKPSDAQLAAYRKELEK